MHLRSSPVEDTSNLAERPPRPYVVKRKIPSCTAPSGSKEVCHLDACVSHVPEKRGGILGVQ